MSRQHGKYDSDDEYDDGEFDQQLTIAGHRKVPEQHQYNNRKHATKGALSTKIDALVGQDFKPTDDLGRCYREVIKDLAVQHSALEHEVNDLKKQLAPLPNSSRWGNLNLLPRAGVGRESDIQHQREISESHKKYKAEIERAQAHVEKLQDSNKHLRQRIAEQEQNMRMQTIKFAQELDKAKSQGPLKITKVSDNEIQNQWKQLCFLVRQFVDNHLPRSLHFRAVEKSWARSSYAPMVLRAEFRHHLQSPMFCPVFLESLIWHCLYFEVFYPGAKSWAGRIGAKFIKQSQSILELINDGSHCLLPADTRIAQFHDWRASSAAFIRQAAYNPATLEEAVVAGLSGVMESLVPPINSSAGTKSASQIQCDILEISHAAMELDSVLRISRADLKVFMTTMDKAPSNPKPFEFGFDFDHNLMQLTNTLPILESSLGVPDVVGLAISPGIVKYGTADGTRYDQWRVLAKLQAMSSAQMAMLQTFQQPQRVEQAPSNMAHQSLRQPALMTPETKRQTRKDPKEEMQSEDNEDVIMQDADIQAEVKTARLRGKSESLSLPGPTRRDITSSQSKTRGREHKSSRPKGGKDRRSRSRTPRERTAITIRNSPEDH